MLNTAPDALPLIPVACGVLRRADGRVLLTQRPPGKVAAGAWEFPGGKIETGESAAEALARELHEELHVEVERARPLIRLRHAYSNRVVRLDAWLVSAHRGTIEGREGQRCAWVSLEEIERYPVLPTVAPILASLRLPEHYVFTPPDADAGRIEAGLSTLPEKALLRLRLPGLAAGPYEALARRLLPAARARGLKLILDREPEQVSALDADGWHAPERVLRKLAIRPVDSGRLFLASVHGRGGIERARALGAAAVVLGTVHESRSHPGGATLGWPGFAALAHEAGLPAYAIGGLARHALHTAFEHGAQGVAGIGAYWPAEPGPGRSRPSGASSAGIT